MSALIKAKFRLDILPTYSVTTLPFKTNFVCDCNIQVTAKDEAFLRQTLLCLNLLYQSVNTRMFTSLAGFGLQ